MKRLALALTALLAVATASAQSPPSPPLTYGKVPTAGEWNSYFQAKQDTLNFSPLNRAGGTMSGRLATSPSTVNNSGFAILPGIAPTSPANGDVWVTSAGLFARVNGVTLAFPDLSSVAITGGTINNTVIGNATPSTGGFTALSASSLTLTTPLPVSSGGTGLSSGTSGGIPYFAATGTLASSGALTANRLVLGGGAGAAPTVLGSAGTTTTVLHGNAAGAPTFGAVSLTADVSGTLPLANGGIGDTTLSGAIDTAFGSTRGSLLYRGASGWTAVTPGTSGYVLTSNGAGADPSYQTPGAVSLTYSPVRQTVQSGPASSGAPSFLPSTNGSLAITSQNVSTGSAALILTAANGFGANGAVDVIYRTTSNLTWSSLSASSTVYLYVNASTGATGSTTLAPIYQASGTPSTTSGQFTFNWSEMVGYLGNGTTAPATPLVFVGEVTTSGSAVTASVAYAYQGQYDSGFTATLPGASTATAKSHNLGVPGDSIGLVQFIIQCTTADNGYAIGDTIVNPSASNGSVSIQMTPSAGRLTMSFPIIAGGSGIILINKTGSGQGYATAASWKYKLIAKRAW